MARFTKSNRIAAEEMAATSKRNAAKPAPIWTVFGEIEPLPRDAAGEVFVHPTST